MGIAAQRISRYLQLGCLAPGCIRARGGYYLSIAGRGRVGSTLGKIHFPAIGSEATGSFVIGGIKSTTNGFGFAPFSPIVFFWQEDVAGFGAGDSTKFITFCLIPGRGEIELVVFIAQEHGWIVVSSGVEYVHLLYFVSASFFLPDGSLLCRFQSVFGKNIVGHGIYEDSEFFFCLFVFTVFQEHTGVSQAVVQWCLVVTDGIAISGNCLRCRIDLLITASHLQGNLSSIVSFLGWSFGISLLELVGSIVVFAQRKELLSLLQVLVNAAAYQKKAAECCYDLIESNILHII